MPIPPAFQALLVERVRSLAARARVEGHYAPVRLAALLFAAAEWIREAHRTGEHDEPPPLYVSVAEALTRLDALRPDADPYLVLVGALMAVDADLDATRGRLGNLSASTELEPLESGALRIDGVVTHVIRPRSEWRLAQDARRVLKGPMSYAMAPADHLKCLVLQWKPAPRVAHLPAVGGRARSLVRASVRAWAQGHFRVALCPLPASAGPRFALDPQGKRFTARPEACPITVAELDVLLEAAAREGVALVMLPELHLREQEVSHVAAWLAALPLDHPLVGIAAGSGHVWARGAIRPRNAAPLLGADGVAVWTHHKRGAFRLTREQVEHPKSRHLFEPLPGAIADAVVEDIEGGEVLAVMDTGVGRIALAVCADLLDGEQGFVEAVRAARPAFLLLVSMSPETDRFVERAQELAGFGISTLYVNATTVRGSLRAFAHLALNGTASHLPTRVRWACGTDRPEGWLPGGDRATRWAALPPGSPAGRLVEALGLVIDLCAISKEP